jgi:hypothetical protein
MVIGVIVGVIVALMVLVFVLDTISDHRTKKIANNFGISVVRTDKENNAADVTYTITNNSTSTHTLDSIDVDTEAFNDAEFVTINKNRTDEFIIFGMRTFEFGSVIAPGETVEVVLSFKVYNMVRSLIQTDICIDRPYNCIGRSFSI